MIEEDVFEGSEEPEEPKKASNAAPIVAILAIVCVIALAAWVGATTGFDLDKSIPDPYKSQIAALRDRNIDILKQQQDLQRKIQDLQNEANYNVQRINTLAGQAVIAAGVSNQDYTVNVDTLKIQRTRRK